MPLSNTLQSSLSKNQNVTYLLEKKQYRVMLTDNLNFRLTLDLWMLFDIARKFLFLSPGAAKVPIHSDLKQTKKGGG